MHPTWHSSASRKPESPRFSSDNYRGMAQTRAPAPRLSPFPTISCAMNFPACHGPMAAFSEGFCSLQPCLETSLQQVWARLVFVYLATFCFFWSLQLHMCPWGLTRQSLWFPAPGYHGWTHRRTISLCSSQRWALTKISWDLRLVRKDSPPL